MGKLTNKDWWLGRTDEQKQKRADAVDGLRGVRADLAAGTEQARADLEGLREERAGHRDQLRADLEVERERHRDEQAGIRADGEAQAAVRREEWAEQKAELLADREGRSMGGWGRKRGDA